LAAEIDGHLFSDAVDVTHTHTQTHTHTVKFGKQYLIVTLFMHIA
jgi:hypothetical protein